MQKGIKIVLTKGEIRCTMQALRMLQGNLIDCIEKGCEENREDLKEELEAVNRIIGKMEGL